MLQTVIFARIKNIIYFIFHFKHSKYPQIQRTNKFEIREFLVIMYIILNHSINQIINFYRYLIK